MATNSDPKLLPSLLDRLTAPSGAELTFDPDSDRPRQLAQFRNKVMRDLEYLFNSRRALADFAPDRDHLNRSLLTFGLPDFSDMGLVELLSDDVKHAVAQAIRRFEPRLSEVQIEIDDEWQSSHVLRFHISALLNVEPEREPVAFDTLMALDTRKFEVQGGSG
jgi:type VI secretion system protein ImpF